MWNYCPERAGYRETASRRVENDPHHQPGVGPMACVSGWAIDNKRRWACKGDTLVIDTIGQRVGPLSMVDRYGTPFSGSLHVIERYRLIDGTTARDLQLKHESAYFAAGGSSPPANPYGRGEIDLDPTKPGLQVEITVDDPATFATPWSAFVTYRRVQGTLPEAVCAENTRGSGSSWVSQVPLALKPDF